MKNKKFLIIQNHYILIAFVTLICGCELKVYFDRPQPSDIAELKVLPDDLIGTYYSPQERNLIYVDTDVVYIIDLYDYVDEISEIPQTENCTTSDGKMYLEEKEQCVPFTFLDDDMVSYTISSIDTLFAFRPSEVAKWYSDRLFLNIQSIESQEWITHVFTPLTDESLDWSIIDIPDSIPLLSSLINSYETMVDNEQNLKYVIDPTKEEFDSFLEQKMTVHCETLSKSNLMLHAN